MQKPRHRTSRIGAVALLLALGAIGFLTAGALAGSTRSNATVSLGETNLGSILVNARGHTLYLFAKDRSGRSACSGSCARFWPPLISRAKPTAGSGLRSALLGTTRRTDGRMQVTYNRHPLYTYALDKRAGQTNGEGSSNFGAKWWAVSARGNAVMKPPATTTSTTGTTSCVYPPCP
jgi:predicted lipoprotein with Yx(FWY)xxD motif